MATCTSHVTASKLLDLLWSSSVLWGITQFLALI